MLPFTSLSNVSATGIGTSRDYESNLANHTMIVHTDGAGGGPVWNVDLEGSHDGSSWVVLATASGGNNSATVHATRVMRHVRANMTSWAAGSPATVITATIASV